MVINDLDDPTVTWMCRNCGMPNIQRSSFFEHSSANFSLPSSVDISSTSFPSDSPQTLREAIGVPLQLSTPKDRAPRQNTSKKKVRTLKVLNANCRSITDKRGQFQNLVDSCDPDIVVGTETWLKEEQADGEIGMAGRFSSEYEIHRRDRDETNSTKESGGGVFVAVKKQPGVVSSRQEILETNCEICWVKIDVHGVKSIFMGGYYRPNADDAVSAAQFKESVERIQNRTQSHVWIAGDFNYPDIEWPSRYIKDGCGYVTLHNDFIEMLDDNGLSQVVEDETRLNNTLDLFITNNPSRINRVSVAPGISDHEAILVETDIAAPRIKQKARQIPMWKKADWDSIKSHMDAAWDAVPTDMKENGDPDMLWNWFKGTLEQAIERFVPHRSAGKRNHLPWLSKPTKKLIKKSKDLYRKKRRNPSRYNVNKYRDTQRKIQKAIRKDYWDYVNSIISPEAAESGQDRDANKRFYSYIKHCKKDSLGVSSLKDPSTGGLTTDPDEKSNILNSQFQSAFSPQNPLKLLQLCKQTLWNLPGEIKRKFAPMPEFDISSNGVEKLLKNLKPHKAAGPDKINPLVLQKLSKTAAPILQTIFTRSLRTGQVPLDWKKANVVPIYKKGSKHLAVNYRPVSLTCICSKVMEHIVASQICRHLKKHDILAKNQHGFRSGLSCETQLLEFVHDLHWHNYRGFQVDAEVMDFSKAFDKVPHNRLLYKLDEYGISGDTLLWTKSFLSGRSQVVVVDGATSSTVPVTSGVPQGSVLGPLLFLVFINDINSNISSQIRLFADDTIIYRAIKSAADQIALQEDLNKLEQWAKEWQMEFHPDKCKTIHITRSPNIMKHVYTIYGVPMETVTSVKYLGVNFTSDARWNTHIKQTKTKANGTLNFLQRNLRISSKKVKTTAYQAFVRPRLEYASTVWDPWTHENVTLLESVQRRAARWVCGRWSNYSHPSEMISELKWRSLEQRRIDTRLAMMYKMRNGLVGIDTRSILVPMSGMTASAHPHRYLVPRLGRIDVHTNSFFVRSVVQWNALPNDVAAAPSIDAFKRRVSEMQH